MKRPLVVVSIGLGLVVSCSGGNGDLKRYCTEAIVLAQVFQPGAADLDACIKRNQAALDSLAAGERTQAESCIACIARTSKEECGCCKTNGEYDVLREGDCKSACNTPGHASFCAK